MRHPVTVALVFSLALGTSHAQRPSSRPLPGDRPAQNPRSTRSVVIGRNGMVATSQPLASAAGLKVLQEGGNAVDAAVTAAAVLAVVEFSMTGIGGDLFALVYGGREKRLHALNASGRSGYATDPEAFAALGLTSVPATGVHSITVPGVVDGWSELLARYGTISMSRALAPAIDYAKNGYPVSEIIGGQWRASQARLAADPVTAATFLRGGAAPRSGDVVANPNLARSLQAIANGGRDVFYKGALAATMVADLNRRGSLLELRDFAAHASDWVAPIATSYRGYDVYEMPPNTQGFAALEMLNILEGYGLKALGHNSAEYLHLLVEAKRIAFADRAAFLADPGAVPASVLVRLISKEYAATRRREIDPSRAAAGYRAASVAAFDPSPDRPSAATGGDSGDTVYLTAADGQGNIVSLIQSLFDSFGSGIVAGDTGIVLHNRGSLFTLQPGHPNRLAPHQRPMHTLVPAFVMKDGRPWLSFGVMGGDMQPQGHVQVLVNLIDFGMTVQEAGEAARVRHTAGGVAVESGIPSAAVEGLRRRGHPIVQAFDAFGGFQGILVDPKTGVLMGGSDPRKDGLAIGY